MTDPAFMSQRQLITLNSVEEYYELKVQKRMNEILESRTEIAQLMYERVDLIAGTLVGLAQEPYCDDFGFDVHRWLRQVAKAIAEAEISPPDEDEDDEDPNYRRF